MNLPASWSCLLLLMPSLAWAQSASASAPAAPPVPDWTIDSAPARLVVELDQPDKPMPVSEVFLYPPNPAWATVPIRVFTDAGAAVGSDVLWAATGEPTTLLFDSSSKSKRYKIYFGSNWPAKHLEHAQSGVIVESRPGTGKSIDHLPDMLQAWNQQTSVNGRAVIEGIFEGGNRFGPQANLFERFQGWFDMPASGPLAIAAVSNDASFILVDGKEVVEWPGLHDFRPGLQGQHQGSATLTPGPHLLEYYGAYVAGTNPQDHPLLFCIAAKGGSLPDWRMLTPDAPFFHPMGHAHAVDYQLKPGAPAAADMPPFVITWEITHQSVLGPDIPDLGLISMKLTCLPPPSGTVTWTFDDGTTAQRPSVEHVFPRPGMRQIQASASGGTTPLAVAETIIVHPNWTQLTTYEPQLAPEQISDIMAHAPDKLSASDLASCIAVFGVFKNSDGLLKFLPDACGKMKDIADPDMPYIETAGIYLAREDLPHFAEAIQLLKALDDRCAQDKPPSPQITAVEAETKLVLAQIILKTSDDTGQVKTLLDAIQAPSLVGDEHRVYDILHGDLALATGDLAGARKQYEQLTGDPSGPDARSSIRRTARIGQARVFLDRKDYESAEDALNEVANQAPIEKLSSDWALTRLRLYQEERLPGAAYVWAMRLLPVVTEGGRSELLYRLVTLAFAEGHEDVAKKYLSELLEKHPFSEEAAKAKDLWPGND